MKESSIVNLQSVRHDHTAPAPAVKPAIGVFLCAGLRFSSSILLLFHAQLFKLAGQGIAPPAQQARGFLFVPLGVAQGGGEQRALHFRLRFRQQVLMTGTQRAIGPLRQQRGPAVRQTVATFV